MTGFPVPKGGASLILSLRLENKTVVIVGGGHLAASRAFAALEADASVVVFANGGLDSACEELRWRARQGQLTIIDLAGQSGDVRPIESYLSTNPRVSLVCITDTILGSKVTSDLQRSSAEDIYRLCNAFKIPVNITDMPDLCDFSFTSSHRFLNPETNQKTALQIGVTTNGKGCRLAGRVKRDIVARLPREVGLAVEKIGSLRSQARVEPEYVAMPEDESLEDHNIPTPNAPVPPVNPSIAETRAEAVRRRMKWVAQVSEYWPIERLARMTAVEMEGVLSLGRDQEHHHFVGVLSNTSHGPSLHSLDMSAPQRRGKIILAGSGPGHPSLLTMAAHSALTQQAQLVLSDKLVPAAVLALLPREVELRIAKKFPGNADVSQEEMMEAAVEAADRGLVVLRLKQGDPSVFGRVGEEILYFRAHGYEPTIIPGVSSAVAGASFSGIAVTQRGVADSFVVCTAVGRKGKQVKLPGYERGRTLVILMGMARLASVITSLLDTHNGSRDGPAYPAHTPIALIERASMPDQRVIESTLRDVGSALENVGEQRPPGMLIIGWAVPALWKDGYLNVLDEGPERDLDRVRLWLGGEGLAWRVREGLPEGWSDP